ncbi:apolipoprotein N-acyltransferase [Curvivirga aplysinae]|uniref:apolipoprotein N-acyltransferase n=1 Tax=Curvivirga aplysinae TaxID=2529852 RepID=UPI0012BC6F5A|nr:apolipoprotein N-acyltransferase [Curvivirga aplysinae]MTI08750.1 apolipoprotein N-acyltransferase [Curvivirga aplysinae]
MHKFMTILGGLQVASIKKKMLLGVVAGAVMVLALPPYYIYPILFAAFPISAWLVAAARTKKQAFWTGWAIGFGYLVFGLYWISHALIIFSDDFWWMVPFAAIGLPAFLAIYTGLAGLSVYWLKSVPARILGWGAAWLVAEWLRGTMLTGLPWNLIGQSWGMLNEMTQLAAYIGIYGISLLVVVAATTFALIPFSLPKVQKALLAIAILIPVGSYGFGAYRLNTAEDVNASEAFGMRMVQSGIPQKEKWDRKYSRRNFDLHLSLSIKDRPDWVRTIIWPETAAAFMLAEDKLALDTIGLLLPPDGVLLTGAPRREFVSEDIDPQGVKLYNSMLAVDKTGQVSEVYDKAHLVPFGEYVPLKEILPIDKVTQGAVDYSSGPGPRSLNINGLPMVGPLICYEVIFPAQVVNEIQPPEWLLNLTNDAWYGRTSGPYQHLEITRLRAIEEGIPVIRSANTGISAVIDPYGRILQSIPLEESGVVDFYLPNAISEKTVFHTVGNSIFGGLLAIWVILLIVMQRRKN